MTRFIALLISIALSLLVVFVFNLDNAAAFFVGLTFGWLSQVAAHAWDPYA